MNMIVPLIVYVLYYFISKPFLRIISARFARSNISLFSDATVLERQAIFQMIFVVVAHLLVVGLIFPICFSVDWLVYQRDSILFQIALTPTAILLGIGEAVTACVLAEMLYRIISYIDSLRSNRGVISHVAVNLLNASTGGWMSTIRLSMRINRWLGTLLLLVQLSCEEIIFRFLLPACLPGQIYTAGILFVGMQFGGLRHPLSGVFAAIGATVMAVSHGFLLIHMDFVLPLVVAHLSMFLSSLLLLGKS